MKLRCSLAISALAALFVVCAAAAQAGGQQVTVAQERHPAAVTPIAETRDPYSVDYPARCEQPTDREEADLCQQWRSANAAEKAAHFAALQYTATKMQTVGLVLTLLVSGYATIVSLQAARIARRDFHGRDRPVLELAIEDVFWHERFFNVTFQVTNIGQSSAIIRGLKFSFGHHRLAPSPRRAWSLSDAGTMAAVTNPDAVIRQDESHNFTAMYLPGPGRPSLRPAAFERPLAPSNDLSPAESSLPVFFYGTVLYQDQVGIVRERSACMSLTRYGGFRGDEQQRFTYRGQAYDLDRVVRPPRAMPAWYWDARGAILRFMFGLRDRRREKPYG